MFKYDDEIGETKQSRAFNKLMDRSGPRPACTTQLKRERFDNHEDCLEFMAKHDFITMITNLGNGTVEVEYMS
jgi:hypothetical protein